MDNKKNNLKDYKMQLNVFFIANLIVFICFVINKNFDISTLNKNYTDITSSNSIISGGIGTIIVFILNGFLSSELKASLVFFKLKNPLPGCRVFSIIGKKDSRINFSALEKEHGDLPIDAEAQNNLWYNMLDKYRNDPMIFKSHRDYLFARDLTGLSFLFLIAYSICAILITKSIKSVFIYIILLIIQYVICAISGQTYGNRFACNVLAKESSTLLNKIS